MGDAPTVLTMTWCGEALGRHCFGWGIIYSLGMITVLDIVQFGSEEIKREVLGGFVKGTRPLR